MTDSVVIKDELFYRRRADLLLKKHQGKISERELCELSRMNTDDVARFRAELAADVEFARSLLRGA